MPINTRNPSPIRNIYLRNAVQADGGIRSAAEAIDAGAAITDRCSRDDGNKNRETDNGKLGDRLQSIILLYLSRGEAAALHDRHSPDGDRARRRRDRIDFARDGIDFGSGDVSDHVHRRCIHRRPGELDGVAPQRSSCPAPR